MWFSMFIYPLLWLLWHEPLSTTSVISSQCYRPGSANNPTATKPCHYVHLFFAFTLHTLPLCPLRLSHCTWLFHTLSTKAISQQTGAFEGASAHGVYHHWFCLDRTITIWLKDSSQPWWTSHVEPRWFICPRVPESRARFVSSHRHSPCFSRCYLGLPPCQPLRHFGSHEPFQFHHSQCDNRLGETWASQIWPKSPPIRKHVQRVGHLSPLHPYDALRI